MRLSTRQLEMLRLIDLWDGMEGWGELWTHWDERMGGQLSMVNFDRIAAALSRRGLISRTDSGIELTDAGRAVLRGAK